jgi:hypothetical protein
VISRELVGFIVFVSLFIFWIAASIVETPLNSWILKANNYAVAGIYFVIWAFDTRLWKMPLFNKLLYKPVLEGTWKGTYASTYENPDTKEVEGPVEAYFSIEQTYSSLHLRFITAESTSESTACELKKSSSGQYEIYAVYINTPRAMVRERSAIHRGGLILSVVGKSVEALEGVYWTDRKTTGDLKFSEHSKVVYNSFDSAQNGFASH